MHIVAIVALLGAVGLGFENDWAGVKAYKSYNECREANPKFHNTNFKINKVKNNGKD